MLTFQSLYLALICVNALFFCLQCEIFLWSYFFHTDLHA